ncbi:DNA-binding protein [Bacteroidia bacterium]|nr:DNA-binding protein [Bacteroidia bacterium]
MKNKDKLNISDSQMALYQPDNSIRLDVKVEEETVWLTQAQMVELFQTTLPNISMHIRNVFKESELDKNSTVQDFLIVQKEGNRTIQRTVSHYNLDMIISIGYRVKSKRGIQFRQWANQILKDYLLKGYAVNYQIDQVKQLALSTEQRVSETEKQIALFVKRSLPPTEGIFYDGQVFDAYTFVADLVKSAKISIVLIDNYVDESVLLLLSKRAEGVEATIYTKQISPQFQLDLKKHHEQYPAIMVKLFTRSHDRFLLIDDEVYHIGASLKDLGKKWFAFSKMELDGNVFVSNC